MLDSIVIVFIMSLTCPINKGVFTWQSDKVLHVCQVRSTHMQ